MRRILDTHVLESIHDQMLKDMYIEKFNDGSEVKPLTVVRFEKKGFKFPVIPYDLRNTLCKPAPSKVYTNLQKPDGTVIALSREQSDILCNLLILKATTSSFLSEAIEHILLCFFGTKDESDLNSFEKYLLKELREILIL